VKGKGIGQRTWARLNVATLHVEEKKGERRIERRDVESAEASQRRGKRTRMYAGQHVKE
jgi:hypothetical protein